MNVSTTSDLGNSGQPPATSRDFRSVVGILLVPVIAVLADKCPAPCLFYAGACLTVGGLFVCGILPFIGRKRLTLREHLPPLDRHPTYAPQPDLPRLRVRFPKLVSTGCAPPSHVVGTSGAWKAVMEQLNGNPAVGDASRPAELLQWLTQCESQSKQILERALTAAAGEGESVRVRFEQQLRALQ